MDILVQSALLVGVTSLGLGSSVLARNVRNKLFLSFGLFCALISAWALAFFFDKIFGGFYRVHLVCNVWLSPVALLLTRVMTRMKDSWSNRLFEVTLLSAMGLSGALFLGFETRYPWLLFLIYFSPSFTVFQILRLMWIDQRLRRGLKRLPKIPTVGFARRNFVYGGGLLAQAFSLMDHVPRIGVVIPTVGNVLLTVYLFFLSQAVSQQRLLNFAALLSRFMVLSVFALLLTGVYAVMVAWVENSPGLFFLNAFIASFLLLMLLDPIRRTVNYLTARMLTQKYRKLEQSLRDAQRELIGLTDPGTLFQNILITTERFLRPQRSALYILRSDGTKFRRLRVLNREGENISEGALKEVIATHPLLKHAELLARRGEVPVVLDQILESEMERTTSRTQAEALRGLLQGLRAVDADLIVPLIDAGKILGFIALKNPSPPDPWGTNWGLLPIIYPYYVQAAQTMQNLEIYVRQREKERLAALGEMSAGLAHEIRNPLGAIRGAAQYLDPEAPRPESRFLKIIIEEADRLNRVVTQFLDYSKNPVTEFQSIDVARLVDRVVERMRLGAQVPIEFELRNPTHQARVEGDAEKLQQVIINFIQNSQKALKDRPQAKISVWVDVHGEVGVGEVWIGVEDNGVGISKENLDKIFIPFFTTSPSGTGLGLSISQKIIEAHQGRIEVNSEVGKFTRFVVVLPLAKERDA